MGGRYNSSADARIPDLDLIHSGLREFFIPGWSPQDAFSTAVATYHYQFRTGPAYLESASNPRTPDVILGLRTRVPNKVDELFVTDPGIVSGDMVLHLDYLSPYPMETCKLNGYPVAHLGPRYVGTINELFHADPFEPVRN